MIFPDTLAMVVLALRCVAQEHRHRDLQRFVAPPALSLAAMQQPDGSFGNLHTTALAMQVDIKNL
jgi:gastric intrinsic factor